MINRCNGIPIDYGQPSGKRTAPIDMGPIQYRGYWIKVNALANLMYIERDGYHIHTLPATASWQAARAVIDELVGP